MPEAKRVSIPKLQRELLTWYQIHQRNLPWRKTRQPYRIWISEVMLQQTRVNTVIPYYERFIDRYPTVHDLANTPEEDLLKSWEGLGYYRRARHLLKAAKEISRHYDGKLPSTSKELGELPGFGPYTASAVASIAYNEPIAVLDGNVKRVLSRVMGKESVSQEDAQAFLDRKSPSDFNQAVMELGALICLPRNPMCKKCPLSVGCYARKNDMIRSLPRATKKSKAQKRYSILWRIVLNDKIFLRKRSSKGRWPGYWELPTFESLSPVDLADAKTKLYQDHGIRLDPRQWNEGESFRHSLTHQEIHAKVFDVSLKGKKKIPNGGRMVRYDELRAIPISRFQQKALKFLL